jgi:hypothetical protein
MMRPNSMHLGAPSSLLWYVTISLDVILVAFVLRRRVFRSLPFFALFVFLSTLRSLVLWGVYRWLGFTSRASWFVAWSTQAVLLISRGAVCAELCWHVLRRSTGLWPVARGVLVAIGMAIVLYAGLDSLRAVFHISDLVTPAERGLELAIAVVLISLLFVAHRYRISIPRTHLLLVTGLCFYSLVQMLNNTFYQQLTSYFPWWSNSRIVAFQFALLLWIWAFATHDSDSYDKPIVAVPNLYAEHADEVSRKLRSLDKDVEEIVRK